MNKKTNNKKKSTASKKRNYSSANSGSYAISKQPLFDSVVVDLKFVDPTWVRSKTTSYVSSKEFRMNSAYDVDPAIGGGTIANYALWSAMYTRYRVLAFAYDVEFTNQTDASLLVGCCPTKTSLGDDFANAIDFPEAPYGKGAILAPKGGMDRAKFKGAIDLTKFSGYEGYKYDDVSSGLVTGNPVQMYYFQIGVNSPNLTFTYGCRAKFVLTVQFYQPTPTFV
jgi:hypothetical protein